MWRKPGLHPQHDTVGIEPGVDIASIQVLAGGWHHLDLPTSNSILVNRLGDLVLARNLNTRIGRNHLHKIVVQDILAHIDEIAWGRAWVGPLHNLVVVTVLVKLNHTIAANGFYGPQGRQLRLALQDPGLNAKIQAFDYEGLRLTNYEMESSSLAGLAALMGHRAMTVCCIIAGRKAQNMNTDYKGSIEGLIDLVLERI